MNFNECLKFLDTLAKNNHKSSAIRCQHKLQELGCYPAKTKVFTVTGTNGKGTTCITLESILLSAGYKVGCYLSPHLIDLTERVRINGQNIAHAEFASALVRVKDSYHEAEVGWFELVTLVAILIFSQHELDYLILEVGIGGKQDVVNAIDPDVAIITSIALDHTEILGNTREMIGVEKAGIFRAHKLAICADLEPPHSIIKYAHAIDTDLILYNHDYFFAEKSDGWNWYTHDLTSPLLPYPKFPVANAAAAIAALRNYPATKNISWELIGIGVKHAFLPGRFQIVKQQPLVICDVAHNPHAAHYLAQALQHQPCAGITYALVGMQTKKDIPATLSPMLKIVDQWYISNLAEQTKGATSFVDIAQDFLQQTTKAITVLPSITESLECVLQIAQTTDRIIVFGSFITVEEVLQAKCLLP